MKQKTSKIVALILAIMMLCVALCSCKDDKSTNAVSVDEFAKLKYYMFGSTAAISQGAPEVYEAANKIIKDKINAEVEFVILDAGQYDQKMQIMMGSGEEFDLLFTSNWLCNYISNVSKGALMPLDDLLPKYAPEYYNSLDQKYWDAVRVDGKIYAAINEQIMARQAAFVFRQDMLDETGFDITKITKFEDIDEYFTMLLEKGYDPQKYNFTMSSFSWQHTVQQAKGWEPLYGPDIPGVIDDTKPGNVKVFNQFKTEEFKNYLKYMTKWQKQNIFHMEDLTGQMSEAYEPIVKAEGTYIPGTWKQSALPEWKRSGIEDICIQPYGETFLTPNNVTATLTAVSNTSKNPEKAVMFLNLINTNKELYNTLCYGIEGREYERVGENHKKILSAELYEPLTDWAYGCQFNAYLDEGLEDDAWKQQKEYNDAAPTSPLLGFSFDSTMVQTEILNCTAVATEYMNMAKFGMLDPEGNYNEFIEKLDNAGAEEIIKEMQKQVDEFLKNKK